MGTETGCLTGHRGLKTAAGFLTLSLAACGGADPSGSAATAASPSAPTLHQSLGVIRISVSGIGTQTPTATAENVSPSDSTTSGAVTKTLTDQSCFLQVQSPALSTSDFSFGGEQYISFTFKVRNASGVTYSSGSTKCTEGTANPNGVLNATLVPIVEPGIAINGNTPFITLNDFGGKPVNPSVALSILPTQGMTFNGSTDAPTVAIGEESLQVFTEAEIAATAVNPYDVAGTYLLPYGFVVHTLNPPGGRFLGNSPAAGEYDGQFTYAIKVPTMADNVFAFQMDFDVVSNDDTQVTQAVEEQTPLGDVAANLRAKAVAPQFGTTDLRVLGGTHITSTKLGDPVCTVRTAGTSASPAAYLVKNTTANVASAPTNLTLLPTDPISVGFCEPMQAPTSFNGEFVVNGSQSGHRSANGPFSGSYSGSGTNQLSFTPDAAHPYFPGESVSYVLNANLSSTSNAHPGGFVGTSTIGGLASSSATFPSLTSTTTGKHPAAIAKVDFNHDGIADLAIVNGQDNTVTFLLGNGDGTYTNSTDNVATGNAPNAIVSGDFNNDGLPDLAVTNGTDGTVTILEGYPTGGYLLKSTAQAGSSPVAIVSADFNGDGNLDLAVANHGNNSVTILLGNGDGTFTSAAASPTTGSQPQAIASGDFNGDGKPDLVVANAGGNTVTVFLGGGDGTFSSASTPSTGKTPDALVVGDFNGDGKADVAVANQASNTLTILLGNGKGVFTPTSASPTTGTGPTAMLGGDFNADGKLDLAVINETAGTVTTLLGNGSGGFTTAGSAPTGIAPVALAGADLDADGRMDLVAVNSSSNSVTVLLGYGNGTFSPPHLSGVQQALLPTGHAPGQPITADFNCDGRMDVAVANSSDGTVTVMLGQANGGFAPAPGSPYSVGSQPGVIAAADFNNDGIMDIAVSGNTITVLLGNGSGGFSVNSTSVTGGNFVTGDFNADGNVDLALVTSTGVSIELGNGSGGFYFGSGVTLPSGSNPDNLIAGDFNGDGKLDIAVTEDYQSAYDDEYGGYVMILLGKGDGTLASGAAYGAGPGLSHILAADFNGDGVIDLAVSNAIYYPTIFLGNGDGTFKGITNSTVGGVFGSMVAGDFNGDGKIDFAVVDYQSNLVNFGLGKGDGTFSLAPSGPIHVGNAPLGIATGNFAGTSTLGLVVTNTADNTLSFILQK